MQQVTVYHCYCRVTTHGEPLEFGSLKVWTTRNPRFCHLGTKGPAAAERTCDDYDKASAYQQLPSLQQCWLAELPRM